MQEVPPWRALISFTVLAVGCRSRDHDASSATTPLDIDVPASQGAMAPFLRDDGDGVLATWLEPASGGAHRLRVARWQGSAWNAPTTIAESADLVASWVDVPTIGRAGDGALVASWAEASASRGAYDALVARSLDGGASWKPLGPLHGDRTPAEHGFVSMAPEGTELRVFWLDGRDTGRGGATALRTALVGETIAREAVVDDRVCDCCATAAAATDADPIVVFRDRSELEIRDIAIARAASQAWNAGAVGSDGWEISGCPVNGPATAARGRAVVVAWYTRARDSQQVRVAFSTDSGKSFTPAIGVDELAGDRAPVGRVGVVLDDDGTAIVSWLASAREHATVLVRRIDPTGRRSAELPIARVAAGTAVGVPRMARAGSALVLVWTEPTKPSQLHGARLLLSAMPAIDR